MSDCPGARLNYSRFPMVSHLDRQSRERQSLARIAASFHIECPLLRAWFVACDDRGPHRQRERVQVEHLDPGEGG